MTDSNSSAGNNNLPHYLPSRPGEQHTSSRNALGLLDLLNMVALNQSMNNSQASVTGGQDLVQTLLLRNLLSNNHSNRVDRSRDPLLNYASGFHPPAPSDLALLNLLNTNNNVAAHSLATHHDAQLGISNIPDPSSNDLLRYVFASQNQSLRELCLRLNNGAAPSTSAASLLDSSATPRFVPESIGAAMLHTQPSLGHNTSLQSPLFHPSAIPNSKPLLQEINDPPKTTFEGDCIVPMFTEKEKYVLSEYQSFLRQQMVYVETQRDAERKGGKTQGRNKPITAGQVGVMCIHCAKLPYGTRPRGAVYYPATLEGIYQAGQNMSKNHYEVRCQAIPDHVRNRLIELKRTKSVNVGTGKDYWKKSAENIGICEVDSRLFFEKSLLPSKK